MVHSEWRHAGAHLRLILDHPKGNIISLGLLRELARALGEVDRSPATKLVTLEGAGNHFSYGASIEEHQPHVIDDVLPEFHRLIRALLAVPAPTAAIVRGRCLGGGFELALACDLLFASWTSVFGVPEIKLGVFPPAAAALLPARVGASRAASTILTGEPQPVDRWAAAGLIELTAAPQELEVRVDEWFRAHLAPRSAAALRCAALASRAAIRKQVDAILPELERFYLETLMGTRDAVEGITAFLEKRPPVWSHS